MRTIGTAALLCVLGACDAEDAEAPAAGRDETIRAERLLTAEEVSQALGEPAGPAETQLDKPGLSQAAWSTKDGRRRVSLMARTGHVDGQGGDAMRASLRDAGAAVEDVTGLGRSAFWTEGSLYAYDERGNAFILMISDGPGAKDRAVGLMRKALERADR